MTELINFHNLKACGFYLNKSHLSNDANKKLLFTKSKTKDEKFDARCQLKSINLYLGLRKK